MRKSYRSDQLDLQRIDAGSLRGAAVADRALMRNELPYRIALADSEQLPDAQILKRIPAVLPLHQAACMLGGLQIRVLRQEWVDSGKLEERDFPVAILREGPIPIALAKQAGY